MIQVFINRFLERKQELRGFLSKEHPDNYKELVTKVFELLDVEDEGEKPNPEIIHEIDDGHYQGTLLYLIPAATYQPRNYWYVFVDYGSCSGCDALQSISKYSSVPPTEQQLDDYMKLALDIVEGIKRME